MKSRYINWVENLSWDWCISRQRFYGIPFPAWHCLDCNEVIFPEIKDLPVDPQNTKIVKCFKCSSNNIVPDTDVMDTWNTSSLTPQICFSLWRDKDAKTLESVFGNESLNQFIPMSMRPQAHDIIRTWAFYTIVKSWMPINLISQFYKFIFKFKNFYKPLRKKNIFNFFFTTFMHINRMCNWFLIQQ